MRVTLHLEAQYYLMVATSDANPFFPDVASYSVFDDLSGNPAIQNRLILHGPRRENI